MVRLYLLLSCLLWSEFACAQTPPIILVLGDSLSAAYGIDEDRGWVALCQQRLKEQGFPHRIENASISGETTRGGLTRLPDLLALYQPAVVILELGANDGLRGLSLKKMRQHLDTMIKQSQATGAQVLLLGVRLPLNYGQAYLTLFSDIYGKLAQQYALGFVRHLLKEVAEHPELMQEDGIHPNAVAQTQVLDNVWEALLNTLKNPG